MTAEDCVRLRKERGLTQEQLAHLAGLSVKTVSRFERGVKSSFTTEDSIMNALNSTTIRPKPSHMLYLVTTPSGDMDPVIIRTLEDAIDFIEVTYTVTEIEL